MKCHLRRAAGLAVRKAKHLARGNRRPTAAKIAAGTWSVQDENSLPGTDEWKLKNPGPRPAIEGFADHASVISGESFQLFVSTTAPAFAVQAFRMGWYGGKQGRKVWSSKRTDGRVQADPVLDGQTNMVSAPWQPSLTVSTKGWPEGCYLLKLVSEEGHDRWVTLTVRSTVTRGKTVLINAVTTWLAYNEWGGGYNIYSGPEGSPQDYDKRSRKVSLDRPFDKNGSYFGWYELPVLSLAERMGLPLAYATDFELDDALELFSGASAVVFASHDEYWTSGMFENAIKIRDAGTNLAILGANTAYRHVRLEDSELGDRRIMVCFKQAKEDPMLEIDPDEATQQWRLPPNPRPESVITGVIYEANPVDAPFVVVEPDHWIFDGTGAAFGSAYEHLVGVEYDRLIEGMPTPRPLQVLSDSSLRSCGADTHANSSYYTVPSGAGVFSTGSLIWCSALPGAGNAEAVGKESSEFALRVTRNVLRVFSEGPAGRRYPAQDNYEKYARPPVEELNYSYEY